jgi:long-chain acyl-CoA synthetase
MNLVSLLLRAASEAPSAVAVVQDDRSVTFAELQAAAAARAAALAAAGVPPGGRVAMALGNDLDFVTTYLGILWRGGVAVPLNPASPAPELARRLRAVRPHLVVAAAGVAVPEGEWTICPPEALAGGDPSRAGPEAERDDTEPAVLLFTSGVAGAARAAVLTHGCLAANLDQVLTHPGLALSPGDTGIAFLPFFHVFGLNVALGVGLAGGFRTVLPAPFTPAGAADAVRSHGVTVLAGVPTMYAAWCEDADVPADAFATVRLAISGAAELPEEVAARFAARFGVVVHQGYGLTEASPVVTTTAGREPRPGSVGPPLAGVSLRIVEADGAPAEPGDPGEVLVAGPNVFAGYWEDPEATARALRDGWLHTGDVGFCDPDGELHLVDRAKDLVIVSGFNVYPAEVEEVLLAHPDVADAAVVGVPHPRTGEAVAAFVVPEAGRALDPDALRAFVARHLARYKVPGPVRVVEALPRNEAGKLIRRELPPPD